MKDFFEKDFGKYEWILYGVIYPLAIIIVCGIAGWLESL